MDDITIAANNPSKYMHDIEIKFNVRDIMDSTNYYLVNELVRFGNHIHVSSNNYLNGIMHKYQNTHGDPKKKVLPMRFKGHPDLDDSPLLNDK